jgi:hypothetical protein
LARNPRWTFHFTPTSASWLNAIEGFFATLAKPASNAESSDRSPTSKPINRFLDNHNAPSKPFEWLAGPNKIIPAVKPGHQLLDSIH